MSQEGSNPPKRSTLSDEQIGTVVAAAVRAPSVHNTQPWLVEAAADALYLRADRSRQLPATDPSGRELLLSCGAALFNLRVALRQLGRRPHVELFPDPLDPNLLARVSHHPSRTPTAQERHQYAAIYRRHTHRGPFLPVAVAPEVLRATQAAAQSEGGTLFMVEEPGQRQAVNDLVAAADRAQHARPDTQEELTAWTPPPASPRRDGVPAWSYASDRRLEPTSEPTTRDFDRTRGYGGLSQNDDPASKPSAAVAVLLTPTDQPTDHLRAGQALQAALLTAAVHWVFAGLHSQPLELESLRRRLRDDLPVDGYPQMLLRLGRADTARPTPRRPVDEVLRPP